MHSAGGIQQQEDGSWLCRQHVAERQKALDRKRERRAMKEAYAQTMFMNYVSLGSALEEAHPEAARKHLRWLKEQARMAAEVLFEEES